MTWTKEQIEKIEEYCGPDHRGVPRVIWRSFRQVDSPMFLRVVERHVVMGTPGNRCVATRLIVERSSGAPDALGQQSWTEVTERALRSEILVEALRFIQTGLPMPEGQE